VTPRRRIWGSSRDENSKLAMHVLREESCQRVAVETLSTLRKARDLSSQFAALESRWLGFEA